MILFTRQWRKMFLDNGIQPNDVVIVRNPPGYFIGSGRSSVSLPFGDESTILAVAERYNARYLVIEKDGTFEAIQDLYDHPQDNQSFVYLGEVDGARLYRIEAGALIRGLLLQLSRLIAVGFYLLVSASIFRIGFPLDDTWIHLTYARNLAEHGEWAFRLGESSAGSTSPLWTVLLSIGFLLRLAPYIWTFFLGWVVLTLLGIQAENIARRSIELYKPRLPWVGLFFVLAWHLTWSAVSGMETLLHGFLVLVVLGALTGRFASLSDPRPARRV